MSVEERLDQLTQITNALKASVAIHSQQIAELLRYQAEADRLWQAYLERLPRSSSLFPGNQILQQLPIQRPNTRNPRIASLKFAAY
jgi:hypothetical protein